MINKISIIGLLFSISVNVFAGGRITWAVPTQIDIERANGVMVYGSFGNPAGCTIANRFYIKKDHPQYEKIYAALLTAYTAKKRIRAYIHGCEPVTWYSVSTTTYNVLGGSGDFNIKD